MAQEPAAGVARVLPPNGIDISSADRERLSEAVALLQRRLAAAHETFDQRQRSYLPDVEIYERAAAKALEFGEFYTPQDVERSRELLAAADLRLDELTAGGASWSIERGLVVRGFRSRLDDTVQPYGVVIPEKLDLGRPCPMYVWLHGRGDKTLELGFLDQRSTTPGTLVMDDGIVLHPFGRYCNAYKFAGETDVFEAIDAAMAQYSIDPRRIVLCGFSMGGAGAWHLGAHYAERWAGVHCGAGFAETARYQKISKDQYPPWYETTLWRLYDAPCYVRNLFNVPVLAYSGEQDPQMQAARVMEEAFAAHGRSLPHLIGPGMGHKYHPDSLADIRRRLAQFAEQGSDPFPQQVTIETQTLRYNRLHWVEILALERHWTDARVDAGRISDERLTVSTKNVTALRLALRTVKADRPQRALRVRIDQTSLAVPAERLDAGELILSKDGQGWRLVDQFPTDDAPRKRHGLQGPIDDVLFEPFLVVTPSGACRDPAADRWVKAELAHFVDRWRRLFRGEPRIKADTEVTDDDLKRFHVIVWGDDSANQLLARMSDKLPIQWTADSIAAGEFSAPAAGHALAMINPNPLAPDKYVVLNSGITFREGHDKTNSQQTPKLPDWAVIDLSTPPSNTSPGRIAAAGFFDERWQLPVEEPSTH